MTRFPLIALAILFGWAPALAQNTAYSFDNFDTRNGVRVQVEPPKAPAKVSRTRRPNRIQPTDKIANQSSLTSITLGSQRSWLAPTVLTYDPRPAQINRSSRRGYTTEIP